MTKILTGGAAALVIALAFVFGQNVTIKQNEIAAATSQAGVLQQNIIQPGVTNQQKKPRPEAPKQDEYPVFPLNETGCTKKAACNYDPKAQVLGDCTFARFVTGSGADAKPSFEDFIKSPLSRLALADFPKPNSSCDNLSNCNIAVQLVIREEYNPPRLRDGKLVAQEETAMPYGYYTQADADVMRGTNACQGIKLKKDDIAKVAAEKEAAAKKAQIKSPLGGNTVPQD